MEIVDKYNKRTLVKENKDNVDISDGYIIKYTGVFYKGKNDNKRENIYDMEEIENSFVGMVETCRGDSSGTTGVYLAPLYMYEKQTDEWLKIANYTKPTNKYFLYPHLLMLPDKYYHYKPLYFLHTCENININDFNNVTNPAYL
jgi:hypothetical protein